MTFNPRKTNRVISKPRSALQNAQQQVFMDKGLLRLSIVNLTDLVRRRLDKHHLRNQADSYLYYLQKWISEDIASTFEAQRNAILAERTRQKELEKTE